MSNAAHTHMADEEKERLHLLERALDPLTIRRLEYLGVQPGWRCLEVGAGAGSIAHWLAARVGAHGTVVATDSEPRLAAGPDEPQLEVRRHDIRVDPLESAAYDLVHARALLLHLADPAQAIERMAEAVCPGGMLLLEEFDWISFGALDQEESNARIFEEKMTVLAQSLRAGHVMNLYLGRHLRGFLAQRGFLELGAEGATGLVSGGSLEAEFQRVTLRLAVPYLLAAGLWTESERDTVERLLQDPTFAYVGGTLFQAWGRRARGGS
jgi:SAM-dependent methyltransferase